MDSTIALHSHKILKSHLELLDNLKELTADFFHKKNEELIISQDKSFVQTYETIKYYKWKNQVSKFVLSQINDYYKNITLFWTKTYYQYNKAWDLYKDIAYLRYKFFEFLHATNQENKIIIHYIFLFQFIDLLLSKGSLILEARKIIDTAYNLFPWFLQKLKKIENLSKYRPVYYYTSIMNIELTNKVWIGKHFLQYPYSIRFLAYSISKYVKSNQLSKEELINYIKSEIENKENKIGSKFRENGSEHKTLVAHILTVLDPDTDTIISEHDKQIIWMINERGDFEDNQSNYASEGSIHEEESNNELEEIDNWVNSMLFKSFIGKNNEDKKTLSNIKLVTLIWLFFHTTNLEKFLLLNSVFSSFDNLQLAGILNIIKSKQWLILNKNKNVNLDIVDINNKLIKL